MALGKVIRELGVKVGLYFDKKGAVEAKNTIEEVASTMKGLAVNVSAAAGTIMGFAKIASGNSRELMLNSQMLGINAERLQELEYAAKVASDVSRDELMGALEGVSKTLDDVRRGNIDAAYTFNRLGIGMDVIGDRSVRADQVLMKVADQIRKIPDPIAKTAIATQVFGGAGARLLPLLDKGSAGISEMGVEARGLGVILGQDALVAGKKFDESMSRIWIILKNVTYLIGNQLIKYLKPLVMEFQKFVVQNKKFIALGIGTVIKSLGYYLGLVFKTVRFLAERFRFLVDVMGGLDRVAKGVAIAFGLIAGAQIVSGVGKLAGALGGAVKMMSLLNLGSLAVGAAIAAVLLVAQDLFSDDSLLKEWFAVFEKKFPNLAGMARDFVSALVAGAQLVIEGWKLVWGLFEGKAAVIKDVAKTLLGAAETAAKWIRSGAIGDKIYDAVEYFKGGPAGGTVAPSAAGASTTNQKNNFDATVNVSVPQGTSARAATEMVSTGVEEAFNSMLRQTRNQAVGGVAY